MKLISGGQTGVDRAVLDVAVETGLPYGGWCPKGGWAEDFPEPPGLLVRYPDLRETPLADPAQRTEWNIRDADACLILVEGTATVSRGTELAQQIAHRQRKPLLVADLRQPAGLESARLWLRVQQVRFGAAFKLAIGGPRQSESPGIYDAARNFLRVLLGTA